MTSSKMVMTDEVAHDLMVFWYEMCYDLMLLLYDVVRKTDEVLITMYRSCSWPDATCSATCIDHPGASIESSDHHVLSRN
jgi:hypothetical protein